MEYSVEYGQDIITLTDGVAYVVKTNSLGRDTALRTFFYEIIDEDRDVNVVLYNKKGIQKFYGNVVNKPDRYNSVQEEYNAKIDSKNSLSNDNPYIKITSDSIAAGKCGKTCVLVISIYSKQSIGD